MGLLMAYSAIRLAASSRGDAGRVSAGSRSTQTWAMHIKRVYEIDPLACPCCVADYQADEGSGRAFRKGIRMLGPHGFHQPHKNPSPPVHP